MCFGGVGEPHDLVEAGGPVGGGNVGQDAAGRDGTQLLVVSDEADAGAAVESPADHVVQAKGVGHPSLVDDQHRVRVD